MSIVEPTAVPVAHNSDLYGCKVAQATATGSRKASRVSVQLETRKRSQSLILDRARQSRRVYWRDDTGEKLCQSIEFRQQEETLRCNPAHYPAVLKRRSSSAGELPTYRPPTRRYVFTQRLPTSSDEIESTIRQSHVLVESVCIREPFVFLTVRVANLSFHKHVFVRYTQNNWESHQDRTASYLPGIASNGTDRFYVTLNIDQTSDHDIEFAVGFQADGNEYWDNNRHCNYRIRSVAGSNRRFGVLSPSDL